MKTSWKANIERQLLSPESPAVLTTAMLQGMSIAGHADAPSPATFNRWLSGMTDLGKLAEVIKGVYLNRLGHREVSPAAAAHWVRHRSVVSLAWVLEQKFVLNNYGDTYTCVIAIAPGLPNPNIGDRRTKVGTFRFFAMPEQLVGERAGKFEDVQDANFDYPRATLEKAFLDWIYLGASPRSRMQPPPLDLDFSDLDRRRVNRLAKRMNIVGPLTDWLRRYESYQADPDVRENSATRLRL